MNILYIVRQGVASMASNKDIENCNWEDEALVYASERGAALRIAEDYDNNKVQPDNLEYHGKTIVALRCSSNPKQTVIDHLRRLGKGQIIPIRKECGLCTELQIKFGNDILNQVMCLVKEWPDFSGIYMCPVPHEELDPITAYKDANRLWDRTPYGDKRREMCLWLADRLEKVDL